MFKTAWFIAQSTRFSLPGFSLLICAGATKEERLNNSASLVEMYASRNAKENII